jgi:hypothetical protein
MSNLAFILAQIPSHNLDALVETYTKSLRSPFITGFFTLTGVNLAIGGFLWLKVKESVYDKAEYQARVVAMRHFNSKLSSYGPLYRFLYKALIAAVCQATLGMVEKRAAVIICLLAAGIGLLAMFVTMFFAFLNVRAWHRFSEENAAANQAKKTAAT